MTLEQKTEEQERNDRLLVEAAKIAIGSGKVSTSLLQRKLGIGYGRAAKIIDRLLDLEYIRPAERCKPNETVVTAEQLQKDIENGVVVMGEDPEDEFKSVEEETPILEEVEETESQLITAARIAIKSGKVSTSLLQRKMSIGYGKAAMFIDQLIELKYVLPSRGPKPHDTVVTEEQLEKDITSGVIS